MDAIKLGSCKRVIRSGVVKFGTNIKQMLMDKGYRVEAKPNHPGWWWWIRLGEDGSIETWMGAQPDSDAYEITDSEEWAWAEALEHYVTLPPELPAVKAETRLEALCRVVQQKAAEGLEATGCYASDYDRALYAARFLFPGALDQTHELMAEYVILLNDDE